MDPLPSLLLAQFPELAATAWGQPSEQGSLEMARLVQGVAGTQDPAALRDALSRDVAMAARLRVALLRAAALADGAARRAEFDTMLAAARGSVGRDHAPSSWAAPLVSVIVLATFGVVMWAALNRALPAGSETILTMLLGTLAAMATSVVGYWVGSSAGSATKTDMLFRARPGAETPPAPKPS